MMPTKAQRRALSFDEFCDMVPDGQKADLIEGVMYVASPDNTDANDLFVWLLTLIFDFVELRELGKVFGTRVAFRLKGPNGPEPDIAFVCKNRLHLVKWGYVDGSPDVAMEIVSPESVERDYGKKRLQYQQARVPEYWIIDEELEKVTLLRLDRKGVYREVRPKGGALHSQVLPGFFLRPEWLWQATRGPKTQALAQILAAN